MEQIRTNLMSCLPPHYTLEWNANPLQPIRYRINTTKEIAEVHNFLWTEAIIKFTGIQPFSNEKSIRFTIPYQTTNISISIFPSTGTIMLQGNSSPEWANIHMPKICNYVIDDTKGYLKSATCIVCGGESNNEMVVCDREHCTYWTHTECAGMTEEAARTSSYWCKACVDQYVDDQNTKDDNQINPTTQNITSTPNKTSVNMDELDPTPLNLSNSPSINTISLSSKADQSSIFSKSSQMSQISNTQGNLFSYQDHLESKLECSNSEKEEKVDLSTTSEIKKLINELRNKISDELDISKDREYIEQLDKSPETPKIIPVENRNDLNNSKESLHVNEISPLNTQSIQETNSEINMLKNEIAQKNADIDSYINKILHLEEMLNLKGSPQQTKHRLEHRNVQSIIKEFAIVEDRLKLTQTQLNQEQNMKICYKQKLSAVLKEKESLENEVTNLKISIANETKENHKIFDEKDNEIIALKARINDLQKDLNHWVKSHQNYSDQTNIIRNLEEQIAIDDEIKRNLNDCLEEAYSEIKDLTEVSQIQKTSVNHKSTNTTETFTVNKEISQPQQQVIDLSLPTRFRARVPEGIYRNENLRPPPNELRLDNIQLEYQRNYRKSFENEKRVPNYIQRLQQNHQQNVNINNDQNAQHHQPMSNIAKDLQRDQTFDHGEPVTLDLRFTRHNYHGNRSIDSYDFAKKDNRLERTRDRPICKWYLRNECNSDVCIYRHPAPGETSNPTPVSKQQNSNRPVCRFYLQDRCWFGDWHCRNRHPKEY